MTTLTCNDPSSALASSTLSLRVVQPGVEERIVPLPTGKCTVGSSDRCQVHLTDAQVRPLHCLIVHEGSKTLVTRWAPGALLNEQEFATSPFHPGDCLQIGDVQVFLDGEVASECDEAQEQTQEQPAPTPVSAAENAFAMMPTQTPAIATVDTAVSTLGVDQLERLKMANEGARNRCRKLVGSLRTMRNQADGFEQRLNKLQQQLTIALEERELISAQLSQLQGEAGDRANQSSEEIDRMISELTAAYEKASVAESALAEHVAQAEQSQKELASLQGEREQWEQIRTAGELQRSKLAQALADREQSMDTLQSEIENSRETERHAEANSQEQTAMLEAMQAELEQVLSEREQLGTNLEESRQSQQEAQQSQADSEQNLAVFQLELEKFQITSRQTEQDLNESHTILENLQAELAPLYAEREEWVAKRSELQLRDQGLEHELASRDSQIQELSDKVQELQASLDAANTDVASQASQTEKFEQQLGALAAERDQLLEAQGEQGEKLLECEETITARDRRITELEEEHIGICEMLQTVEKGAFEQVDSCNKLEEQLTNIRAERDQLAETLPAQQEAIKYLEQALAERDGQISLLSDELTKTSQRQMELETELAEGNNAYQALETNLDDLTVRCEQLLGTQSSSDENQAIAELALNEYQTQVEELQMQIALSDQQRQNLEQSLASGSQSSETLQAEFVELQTRYEQLTNDHQSETERRHDRDQKLADQQQHVELFQTDLKVVQAELDRTANQVSSLQTERETLNQQLLGLREELAAREENVGEEARVSQNLLVQMEEEKSLLAQKVEQQAVQTEQLAMELEQARQCLLTAEQALLQRTEVAAVPIEKTSVEAPAEARHEPAAWPSEPDTSSAEVVAEDYSTVEVSPETEPDASTSDSTAFDKKPSEQEETPEEFEPTSFIDQYEGMLEEESEESSMEFVQSDPEPTPVVNKLGAELDAMESGDVEKSDDEADLEAYMSSMLQRMRGETGDEEVASEEPSNTTLHQNLNSVAAAEEGVDQVALEKVAVEEPENLEPMKLEELKRSSRKPTLPTDLAAMRELANSSARRAISKHHKRLHREKAFGYFLACLLTVGMGVFMLMKAVAAQEYLGLNFFGGSVAVLIGVGVGIKLLGQLLLAIRDGSPQQKQTDKSVQESDE